MMKTSVHSRLSLLALATALAAGGSAQNFYQRDLPDYDQRRDPLPNNGNMYCVPTAYTNLLKFMAWNGMPGMDGTFGNGYAGVTNFIQRIADEMDTQATKGTSFSDAQDAIIDWISPRTEHMVVHTLYGPDWSWSMNRIRGRVWAGAMVLLGFGRYRRIDGEWVRQGGHAISLAGYDWRAADKFLLVADPASDDGDLDTQGTFSIQPRLTRHITLNTEDHGRVTHARYTNWSGTNGDRRAVIDYMHAILPVWAGWMSTPVTSFSAAGGKNRKNPVLHAAFPFQFTDRKNPVPRELKVELPGPVRDWCIDHGDVAAYVLGTDGRISRVDFVANTVTKVATMPGARKVAVAGTTLDLYVLQTGGPKDRLVRIDADTGRQNALPVPKGIVGIEPNPRTGGLVALHPGLKRLYSVDEDLRAATPHSVKIPEGTGQLFFGVDKTGEVTVARRGNRTLFRAALGATLRRIGLAPTARLTAFQPIEGNRFLVQDGNRLQILGRDGRPLRTQFTGMVVSGPVRLAQGWTALKPQHLRGPGWREVPPEPGEP